MVTHAPPPSADTRLVLGCMTGTSLDGIDLALAAITGRGLSMRVHHVGSHAAAMPDELRQTLLRLASGEPTPPLTYLQAARALGRFHATAAREMLASLGVRGLDFITAHGQTIWHAPDDDSGERLSWQLFDPWPMVRDLGVPVCFDLRQADLIAGGQGAPITPLADWLIYELARQRRCIVNLGGICNVTWIEQGNAVGPATPDMLRGADVCPCNLLIDGMVQQIDPSQRYDVGGQRAVAGRATEVLLDAMRQRLVTTDDQPRTLGREDVLPEVLRGWYEAARAAGLSESDVAASAVHAAGVMIVEFIAARAGDATIVLAGGGTRNPALVAAIGAQAASRGLGAVRLTDELGVPAEAREALGFAVLGALSQDGVPITLPAVTGATAPARAGLWAMP